MVALLFLALRMLFRRVRGRDGIGLGDVKLAGVWARGSGWVTIPIAVEIAALSAIAVYLFRHYAAASPIDRTLKFPFGLFLAPSIWLCWLFEAAVLGAVSVVGKMAEAAAEVGYRGTSGSASVSRLACARRPVGVSPKRRRKARLK